MRLVMRRNRIALNRGALPTAQTPPKTLVDKSETLQLFLERGRKNAESFRGAFLVPSGRDEHGENQIPLEALKDLSQYQTVAARGLATRGRLEHGWIGEVA
jgi:hypothetical protein